MSTNPTATSAYISPTRRPLVMRSIKNSIMPRTPRAFSPLSLWEGLCRADAELAARNPAPTQSRQRARVRGFESQPKAQGTLTPALSHGEREISLHRHQCLTHTADDQFGLDSRL